MLKRKEGIKLNAHCVFTGTDMSMLRTVILQAPLCLQAIGVQQAYGRE